MNPISFARPSWLFALLALPLIVSACDGNDPLAPEAAPAVVVGRVASVVAATPTTPGVSSAAGATLVGIEVSAEGGAWTDVTDDNGGFRLEVRARDGAIVLRFRRGAMDVRLAIAGVAAGSTLRLELRLDHNGVTVLSSSESDEWEFEGIASLLSVDGEAPTRTVRVELAHHDRSVIVDLIEGTTHIEGDGDITTLGELLVVLHQADVEVKIGGEGRRQEDGTIIATSVKVETDDDDDDDDRHEFEGIASLLSVDGEAPTRTVSVALADDDGSAVVDLVEGTTHFEYHGDITTVDGLLAALDQADVEVEIEGRGEPQEDGTIIATSVRVETDDDDDDDRHEFEGVASLRSVEGDAPTRTVRVALVHDGRSVIVVLIEGMTHIENDGDITTLDGLLAVLDQADVEVEIKGRGDPREDGTIVAASIKIEIEH